MLTPHNLLPTSYSLPVKRMEVSQTRDDLPLHTELNLKLIAYSFFNNYRILLKLCEITYKL